ncbi:hypothetical protein ACLBYG_21125 [Methylobacterium sp. D53M]
MSAEILVVSGLTITLLTIALIAASVGNLRANRRTRRLMTSYDGALSAKDEQIAAYERLIATQKTLIEEQRVAIGLREEHAALRADGATRWRRTGMATVQMGGGRGESQWFRPSDGCLRMYPAGFDPNTGETGPVIIRGDHAIWLCPGDTLVPDEQSEASQL